MVYAIFTMEKIQYTPGNFQPSKYNPLCAFLGTDAAVKYVFPGLQGLFLEQCAPVRVREPTATAEHCDFPCEIS